MQNQFSIAKNMREEEQSLDDRIKCEKNLYEYQKSTLSMIVNKIDDSGKVKFDFEKLQK